MFTKDITTDEITSIKDYEKLLVSRLGNDADYDIVWGNSYYHVLGVSWTMFDIKDWLDSLIYDQDYVVKIKLISKDSDGSYNVDQRINLATEFVINRYSNPVIISSFITSQLIEIYNMFNNHNQNIYILIEFTELIRLK